MEQKKKRAYPSPKVEVLKFNDDDVIATSGGRSVVDQIILDPDTNTDVQYGRGRGGGCDGVEYHHDAKTFSSGRNSTC